MNEENKKKMEKLVLLTQRGDTDAFGALYDMLSDSVYRYIYFKVDRGSVEDLLEMTFERVWQNIHQYKHNKYPFSAWVFRIAHNLVVDHYRTKKDTVELSPTIPANDRSHNPIKITEEKFNKETLYLAINKLKENHQQIIILKFINELSNKEIAGVLGKTEGSLRILQFRALKALREVVEEMGLSY